MNFISLLTIQFSNWLELCQEVTVHLKNYTKSKNILCMDSTKLIDVTAGGT